MSRESRRGRLRHAMRSLGTTPAERVTAILTIAIVALGLAFRARVFLFGVRPLWWDEAIWALYLIENRYGDENLRPIGFMAVSRVLCWLFSPSESVLRSLPWIAGVTTTVTAPFLAKRLYAGDGARLLFVAILALHPAAIDLSKEFKPYSVSLWLHVGLLLLTLRYLSTGHAKDLVATLVVAGLGMFFAQDLVFAYPGVFLLLGWEAHRRRPAHLRWVVFSAGLIIAGLAAQYVLIWSRIPDSESTYWGNKYGVFRTGDSEQSYLAWLFDQYRDLREFPGYRRTFWKADALSAGSLETLRKTDGLVWSLAHAVGLGLLLWQRRVRDVVLFVVPCLMLWLFNLLDFWPMGAFRTNLFVLCYMAAIACAAFDWKMEALRIWSAPLVALVLVLLPLVLFEKNWHATKRAHAYDGHLPSALTRLMTLRRDEEKPRSEALLLGSSACPQWEYYARIHPSAGKLRRKMAPLFDARCVHKRQLPKELRKTARFGERVWVVLHRKQDPADLLRARDGETLDLTHKSAVGSLWIAAFRKHDGARDDSDQR